MAVVIASDLGKDIAGEPLLRGISFKLERRDRMTLSGRNGAGKTTLLRMLAGEASIDVGELMLAKGAKVMLHDQRRHGALDLLARLRAERRARAGRDRAAARGARVRRWPAAPTTRQRSTVTPMRRRGSSMPVAIAWRDRALATLHGLGFRTTAISTAPLDLQRRRADKASLGRALAGDPDLLLLDEPTNHLDIESLEWLEQHLASLDAAVVLVAHDRWFLEAVGTSVARARSRPREILRRAMVGLAPRARCSRAGAGPGDRRQEAEIARLERFVTRFRAGTRARQAQSRAKKLTKMERINRAPQDGAALEFTFKAPERSGRVIFDCWTPRSRPATSSSSRTSRCGSSAASMCRSSAPTGQARRR